MTKKFLTQLSILWACAILVGGVLYFELSNHQRLAQRGIIISAAETLAYQWASIRAAQIEPSLFGQENSSPFRPQVKEVPRSTTSWEHDSADSFSFSSRVPEFLKLTKFAPIGEHGFYDLSGQPIGDQARELMAGEIKMLTTAVQSRQMVGSWTNKTTSSGRNIVTTIVPVGSNAEIHGVMRIEVDSSVVDEKSSKWLADGFAHSVTALLAILGIASMALSLRLRRDLEATEALGYLAEHDELTGAYARGKFDRKLTAQLAKKGNATCCHLALFSLNRFKEVNQSVGPAGGDELLRHVYNVAREVFGSEAVIGRMSGDEFALFRSGISTTGSEFEEDIDNFLRVLAEPYTLQDKTISLSVSVGVATSPADGDDANDLMASADMAMQRIKARRLNAWKRYEKSMREQQLRRRKLEEDMRDSLVNNDFQLFYQPQLDLGSGELCGYEALIRWNHPEEGLISPGEFIPLSEETGLIKQLGEWVMNQACRDAKDLPEHLTIAVNISASQFQLDDVAAMVKRAVKNSGIDPRRLEAEVTESVLVENRAYVAEQLEQIAAMGIGVAIDDFGTGYSSLTYLAEFPFSKIKIDRSFVVKMEENAQTGAIVSTIIAMSQSLGAKTIAEGVETETQATLLRAAGCQLAQGFLYGRPEPLVADNDGGFKAKAI